MFQILLQNFENVLQLIASETSKRVEVGAIARRFMCALE
jgi:hypothetical protein